MKFIARLRAAWDAFFGWRPATPTGGRVVRDVTETIQELNPSEAPLTQILAHFTYLPKPMPRDLQGPLVPNLSRLEKIEAETWTNEHYYPPRMAWVTEVR